jgi:hypothetical protein
MRTRKHPQARRRLLRGRAADNAEAPAHGAVGQTVSTNFFERANVSFAQARDFEGGGVGDRQHKLAPAERFEHLVLGMSERRCSGTTGDTE